MRETIDLNEAQSRAAEHIDGPALVLAGAGSGKTRVVCARISHLLSLGIPSGEILAVTFTNKAAEEMQRRVRSMTAHTILACTFHSLAARMLRESITELGFKRDFNIYDEQDSDNLLKQVLKDLGAKVDKGTLKSIRAQISDMKNQLIGPEEIAIEGGDKADKLLYDAYVNYQTRLKAYNAVDFDDLLFLSVKLLKMPHVQEIYQNRWRYLLVDEYQDTNHAQYLICKLLTEKSTNLFVVGDPDQSIYSWRGANIRNILQFEQDFPGANVIQLEQNYRSTGHILRMANALISHNNRPYDKQLWSELGDGSPVTVKVFEHERDEIRFIIDKVATHLRATSAEEIVIFYRTNFQSRSFEDGLLRRGIPYTIIGGVSFYQRREIKDVLAYMRLLCSPADYVSFARVINMPKRGIGAKTLDKLKTLSETMLLPILDLCEEVLQNPSLLKLTATARAGLQDFVQLFKHLRQMVGSCSLKDLLEEIIHHSRYLQYLKEDEETFEDRKENVEELVNKAAEWEDDEKSADPARFLEEMSLKSSADDTLDKSKCIRLMTLHNSKGLEFDICFIVGMEEDLFPHMNSKETPEEVEEERRLCYVGITRAKKALYLTASRYRFLWGSPRHMRPSRFLGEIPLENFSAPERPFIDESSDIYYEGDAVEHKDFGRGIIRKSYETSFGTTYDVAFSDETRTLVAKYAHLRKG